MEEKLDYQKEKRRGKNEQCTSEEQRTPVAQRQSKWRVQ